MKHLSPNPHRPQSAFPSLPRMRFTKRTHFCPPRPRDLSCFQQDTRDFCQPPAATTNPFSAILSSQEGVPMRTIFLCLIAAAAHAATTVYQASVDQLTVVHGTATADPEIRHTAPKSLRVEPGGQYPDALVRSAPVALTIGRRYELSAWVRTESLTVRDTGRSPIAPGAALPVVPRSEPPRPRPRPPPHRHRSRALHGVHALRRPLRISRRHPPLDPALSQVHRQPRAGCYPPRRRQWRRVPGRSE